MRAILPLLLLALTAVPTATHAQSQNPIHRCVGAQGNPVFTDQPCASLQAVPVQAAPPAADVPVVPGAPVPLQRCAATVGALRQRVIDAFAARDPNRLAGLMLWRGYGHVSAVDDVRALARLVRQPLLDIQLGDEADDDPAGTASGEAPARASSTAATTDELRLNTGGEDGARSVRFAITRQAGCLWLRYAD